MPSIEVTPAQAAALARGESISIAPKTRDLRTFVVVNTNSGHVFEFIVDMEADQALVGRRIARGAAVRSPRFTSSLWARLPHDYEPAWNRFSDYSSKPFRVVTQVPNRSVTASIVENLGV